MNIKYNKKTELEKSDLDVNKLLKALDNEKNEKIMNFNTKKMHEMNNKILKELGLPYDVFNEYMEKLEDYKYVDEMGDLKTGSFVRWIPICESKPVELKKGGVLCDVKVTDNGVYIVCKVFSYKPSHVQLKMDDVLIFQKLSDQEKILLSVIDHLS